MKRSEIKETLQVRDLKPRPKVNATNKHGNKNNSLSLRAMQTCNDLLVARGQNGLEKQAVEKRSSRTVLLASCVTTITARAD